MWPPRHDGAGRADPIPSSRYTGLGVPFLLTLLLVTLLDFGRAQEMELERERFQSLWLEAARNGIEKYRAESTCEAQIKRLNYQLRQALLHGAPVIADPAAIPTGTQLAAAFARVFPLTHRPPGTRIIAFSIDPAGQVTPLPCPPFSPDKGTRILAALQPGSLAPEALGKVEKESLDRRFASLFGGRSRYLYKTDVFSRKRRGQLIPCFYEGRKTFILWDFLSVQDLRPRQERPVITYFLLFPQTLPRTTRFREAALRRITRARPGGMSALLVPWTGERFPQVARAWQRPIARRIHAYLARLPKGLGRQRDLPPNRLVPLPELGLMVYRHLLSPHLPTELWLVTRLPRPPSRLDNPLYWLFLTGIGLVWTGLLTRAWLFRTPLPLSIGRWFTAFLCVVGIFPLASLLLTGLNLVDTAAFRQVQTAVREAGDQLDQVDFEANSLFIRFVQESQRLFTDGPWLARMSGCRPDQVTLAARTAVSRFAARGLPLDLVFVLPMDLEPILVPASGPPTVADTRIADFHIPYAYAANRYLLPGGMADSTDARQRLDMARNFLRIYNSVSGDPVHESFLEVRGMGDLVEVGQDQTFLFMDLITEGGKPTAWVLLRGNPRPSYETYLFEACSQLAQAHSDRRFFAGKVVPGGQTPLFPRAEEGNFWRSSASAGLQEQMDLVARTTSRLTFRDGDRVRIIQACSRAAGLILGTEIDLGRITAAASQSRHRLAGLILALAMPILLLGISMARYLLGPLAQVEHGLRQVATGNLAVRVGLPRQDELGRLTQAFDRMIIGLETRRRLGRFVSGSLEAALARGLASPSAAPEELEAAVLVSDLREFTTLSETHPPVEVLEMLNRHLDLMARLIQARGGLIDKFIGDAVVAIFPAGSSPVAAGGGQEDACRRAVAAAAAMMRSHAELQAERRSRGTFEYRIGIGIAAGTVQAGTMGSGDRLEMAVVGPPRAEAERLEGASKKGRHTRIVVSGLVREAVPALPFANLGAGDAFELTSLEVPDAGLG